jgi:Spy/CpxP family protein refolding chaperone
MKHVRPLLLALAAMSAALPLAASAQQQPPSGAGSHHGHPFMKAMRELNLTDAQKSQMRQLISQYREAHPKGSTPDPAARRQLRTQLRNILTPQQQAQLKEDIRAMRPSPSPEPEATLLP